MLFAFSDTWSEHVENRRIIFEKLRKANLTFNLAKCEFGKASVTYLGKQVGQRQVHPVDAKVQAILEYPVPQTRSESHHLLGLVGYYCSFGRNFAAVFAPRTSLTSERVTCILYPIWSPAFQHVFESSVLAAPDQDIYCLVCRLP